MRPLRCPTQGLQTLLWLNDSVLHAQSYNLTDGGGFGIWATARFVSTISPKPDTPSSGTVGGSPGFFLRLTGASLPVSSLPPAASLKLRSPRGLYPPLNLCFLIGNALLGCGRLVCPGVIDVNWCIWSQFHLRFTLWLLFFGIQAATRHMSQVVPRFAYWPLLLGVFLESVTGLRISRPHGSRSLGPTPLLPMGKRDTFCQYPLFLSSLLLLLPSLA